MSEQRNVKRQPDAKEQPGMKNQLMKKIIKRYLRTEVAVDYKACLYFFVILFFYSMYLIFHKIYAASLLHMTEIIFVTYVMGYLQVLALGNFDEAEHFTRREFLFTLLCSLLYAGISYLFGWFDRNAAVTGIFAAYCVIAYLSAYLANKVKRGMDTERLNELLRAYREGGMGNECHRDEKSDQELR